MEMGKRTGTSIEERILVSKLPSGTTASTSCRRTLYITLVADIDRPSKFGSLVGGKVPLFYTDLPASPSFASRVVETSVVFLTPLQSTLRL
jgi:hypothetical protein